jgi:hypothetical protein
MPRRVKKARDSEKQAIKVHKLWNTNMLKLRDVFKNIRDYMHYVTFI